MKNIILIVLMSVYVSCFSQEVDVTNKQLNFSFTIPEEFNENVEFLSDSKPTLLYSYVKGVKNDSSHEFIINIDNLEGVLGKNSKLNLNSKEGPLIELVEWKGLELECVMFNIENMFVCIIQIPLLPSAIQLNVGGPEDKLEEVIILTLTLLESLEGKSNWE